MRHSKRHFPDTWPSGMSPATCLCLKKINKAGTEFHMTVAQNVARRSYNGTALVSVQLLHALSGQKTRYGC
jgi:hypothetical protein